MRAGSEITLADHQLDRLADLIADRLRAEESPRAADGMVDAAALAGHLGTSREWVYRNAVRLGAVRLGAGERGRLRFNLDRARAAFATADDPPPATTPSPPRARRRASTTTGSVLKVRPRIDDLRIERL
jgi:hypothetical protein